MFIFMPLAPIILFVYNRPLHTAQTLEALRKNDLADQSLLYIFADGLKNNATENQRIDFEEVRKIIYSKKWTKEVQIRESEQNKGLAKSIIEGVTEIVQKHGKIIVLEDDLTTAKGFLTYMNQALETYKNEDLVYQISAYTYPANYENIQTETFFLKNVCSWGWATWAEKWQIFEPDAQKLMDQFTNQQKIDDFNLKYYYSFELLKMQAAGTINSWAVRFHASVFLKGGLVLFPKKTLIQNIGFDSSGENCAPDDFYSSSPQTDFVKVEKISIKLSKKANLALQNCFQKRYKPTIFQRIINKLGRIITSVLPIFLILFLVNLACAQDKKIGRPVPKYNLFPLEFAIGNHSVSLPFYRIFRLPIHPAITFGTEYSWWRNSNQHVFSPIRLGIFYNRYNASGVYLATGIGYRYTMDLGLFVDGSLEVGYLHYFRPFATMTFKDGLYESGYDFGKPSVILPFTISIGYDFSNLTEYYWSIFLRYKWFLQTPYNDYFGSDFLPQAIISVGARYQPDWLGRNTKCPAKSKTVSNPFKFSKTKKAKQGDLKGKD
ncbi:MAG: hypothetical protein EAZ97_11365 [Bacteroidetes bacterium]|nr:MAG: hypothetical protein EAZ97_11365 [Bacteroidota bacterium]